ncbi:hypothetical protein [Saccharopolyspora gloriosae]|nr:hypothetical protein [Saccharopolyspora gloriosae]
MNLARRSVRTRQVARDTWAPDAPYDGFVVGNAVTQGVNVLGDRVNVLN